MSGGCVETLQNHMSVNIYLEQNPSTECYQAGKLRQWSRSIKEKAKVATLIGDKCLMDCQIGSVPSTPLEKTGRPPPASSNTECSR